MNKLSKDRVEEIIASADRVQRAEPSPFLFTRIEANLFVREAVVPKIKVGLVFGTAALLIALNLGAIISKSTTTTAPQIPSKPAPMSTNSYIGLDTYNLGLY